ncbi:chemotaxis response regulator protein-glutamate methylesterase [Sporosarcina siberiensis]|uniref:Protein-glutamate methylesterase/protein-glutamine glutaminase n=1 Tax=Sporosarcina siberiensis TaxID=1365606 RepID=A0ABW4SGQ6_9BACL
MDDLETGKIKKALVVDDSAFMRKLISDFLSKHPNIEVIGTARNGKDAIEKVKLLKPDVVTMDVEMPIMDGLEALKEIMANHPVPVVMLSSTTKEGAENTMLAMEYGAVDFVAKPGGAISLNLKDIEEEIVEKVAAASGVHISKLTRTHKPKPVQKSVVATRKETVSQIAKPLKPKINKNKGVFVKNAKTFVIIGTSTGGPRALQAVLTNLPAEFAAPILIVQHMPVGFTKSLADRLNTLCTIHVKEAENGEPILNGTAYIAQGGKHLKMKKLGQSYFIQLDEIEPSRSGHRPAVDVLLESAAAIKELNYLTVIMTGMGSDGKVGMEVLKKNGQTLTIAESAETSVVYGMPKAIVEAGLADEIEDLQDIPKKVMGILKF